MTGTDWRQAAFRGEFRRALLADLHRWLASKAGVDAPPAYALIDAGQLHLTEVDLEALLRQHGSAFEPLLRHTPETRLESVGPYLVPLANADTRALEAIVGLMEYGWPVCFLSSRLPDFKLHTHLRACLNGLLQSGAPVQLRYYDSRVLPPLLATAAEQVRGPLLAPLDSVAWWDRALHWQVAKGGNSSQFQSENATFTLPDTLIAALGRTGEPDLILSLIAEENMMSDEVNALAPHLQYQIVDELVQRARMHGLTSKAAVLLFCSIGIYVCPTFDRELPGIAEALTSARPREEAFLEAVDRTPDDQWNAAGKLAEQQLETRRQHFADDIRSRLKS